MIKQQKNNCLSHSFELRSFSSDIRANGETDFKGETAVFTTEDRIKFLQNYADTTSAFFNDPGVNQPTVSRLDLARAKGRLKTQPQPEVRQRIPLKNWSKYALPARWAKEHWRHSTPPGVEQGEDCLEWHRHVGYKIPFEPQDWRAFFWINLALPEAETATIIRLGNALKLVLCDKWKVVANGKRGGRRLRAHTPLEIKIELDLVSDEGRCNVYVDDVIMVSWQPLRSVAPCDFLTISGVSGLRVFSCRGLGFSPVPNDEDDIPSDQPYTFEPLFNRNFSPRPELENWKRPEYDDSVWPTDTAPCVHGGAMEAGEDMLLRKRFRPPSFRRATLHFESLDPGGEVWINGRLAHRQEGPHGFKLQAERWLRPECYNLIAVRVYHRRAETRMRHTCADRNTGWSMGRVWLDLHQDLFLEDLFVHTKSIDNPAVLHWQVRFRNELWGAKEPEPLASLYFDGRIRIEVTPWYPKEGFIAAINSVRVRANYRQPVVAEGEVEIKDPMIWSVESPRLYKVRAVLLDERGYELDDLVVTTGLRTVSQEGGIFRLNGRPSTMLGGLLFGTRPPIEEQAKYLRRGRLNDYVREILTVRNLGGNTIRMSVHDGPAGGINDPRLPEIGDQLGILFQWTTNEWVRTSSPWQISFEHLADDIRQVRNHPSIVMWQPGNHPKFESWQNEGAEWFQRVVDTILSADTSRLISPTANFDQLKAPSEDGATGRDNQPLTPLPAWQHPMVVRGNMETPTGYGHEWSILRKWPYPEDWCGEQGWLTTGFRDQYLNSPDHAYFDFESEESASQPNWRLQRGQPYHRLRSYEIDYDVGSIGRRLYLHEWRISQAWQAFSAYEAYRKKRLLDYDGMAWCTIDGGGNSGTYEKPLADPQGHRKLAFHILSMVFQPTLGGSRDVNVVYGPDDLIRPVILHLGEARKVDLHIQINTVKGTRMAEKVYPNIQLPEGRSRVDLEPWPRPDLEDGIYVIHYRVYPI